MLRNDESNLYISSSDASYRKTKPVHIEDPQACYGMMKPTHIDDHPQECVTE